MNYLPILKIEDLCTYFYSRSKQAFIRSVDHVGLQIAKGQTLGLVGESGSGKSVTALSIMGLVRGEPGVISGSIELNTPEGGINLLQGLGLHVRIHRDNGRIMQVAKDADAWEKTADRNLRGIRGKQIAMIFQDPKNAMNPFVAVGRQIAEAVRLNTAVAGHREARARALHWLAQVRIDSPQLRYHNNPHGLSGGMCQRAMIAMALAAEPVVLIADEPTTGLDATIQSHIVDLMGDLKDELALTTLLISHDIDVIRSLADTVAVMYGGTIMQQGPVQAVLGDTGTQHPYTAALLDSIPDQRLIRSKGYLQAIRGDVLDTMNIPAGCRFYPRCNKVDDTIRAQCRDQEPALINIAGGHRVRCWRFAQARPYSGRAAVHAMQRN